MDSDYLTLQEHRRVTPGALDPDYLTLQEAAQIVRVCEGTLRRYVRTGRLRAYRLAGLRDLRFRTQDVRALLEPVAREEAE